MLLEILTLLREAGGGPLSGAEIAAHLNVTPAMLEQLMLTLVQRGRVLQVEFPCAGCDHCPLHRFCAGAPQGSQIGYALKEQRAYQVEI